jgi:gliding motility-associated-like protein
LTFADNGKTLTYKAKNSCGETTSNGVVITVNNKPAIGMITAPATICGGSTLALTPPTVNINGSTVTAQGWYLNDAAFNTATLLTFADNGKTLTYKAKNSCGETISNNVSITVTDKPSIAPITAPATICAGSTLALTPPTVNANGSTVTTQGWYLDDADFNSTTLLSFADNGKTLTYKAKNSCGEKTSNEVVITVNDSPFIETIIAPAMVCPNNTLALITPKITSFGSELNSEGWYLNDVIFNPTSLVTYQDNGKTLTYKATNDCGQRVSNSVTVRVSEDLKAEISEPINPELCTGDRAGSFTIKISGGTQPYSVSLEHNNNYEQITGTQHSFLDLSGGSYTAYVKDTQGCSTKLQVEIPNGITINPIVTINYDCINNAATNFATVSIDSKLTNSDVDYALDGGTYQSENIFTNIAPGQHTITARHTDGCIQSTSPFHISEIQPLTLTLANGELNEIVATANGGHGEYRYSFEDEPFSLTNKLLIYKSGIYKVIVTDKYGCTCTISQYFTYVDVCIPNYFTPNGDGISDEWGPDCTINYKKLTYTIIDRYGRTIGEFKFGQKWDGKYKGQELTSGDYWYVIKLNDPKDNREFVGHFTLYR